MGGVIARLKRILFYIKVILSEDWDLVIETVTKSMMIEHYLKYFKKYKYRLISWFHFTIKDNEEFAKYAKYADGFWAISSGIKDELLKLDISPENIQLIYNPVDHAPLIPLSNQKVKKIAYVGRLEEKQKNITEIFTALSNCDSTLYELYIYGDGTDREYLQEFSKEKDVNAYWMGWSSNPWEEVRKNGIDYLIMSSKFEGFPMVLLESIARGIPIVSSNCPDGPKDIVKPVNGFLYPVGDVEALTEILQQVLHQDMSQWNQEEIQKSIDFYTEDYLKNLDQIINREGN